MYDNANVHTKFNGVRSDSWGVGNGVRQGGILSSLLFSFYINDILEMVTKMPVGCSLMGYKTNIICYADDIILLSPTACGLQIMLDKLCGALLQLCLTTNAQKS